MSSLRPCPACRRHIETRERACPFCAAALPADFHVQVRPAPRRATSRAALLFLGALTGEAACKPECAGPVGTLVSPPVPPYGVAPVRAPPSVDAGTDGGEGADAGPGEGASSTTPATAPVRQQVAVTPPYGVAPLRAPLPIKVPHRVDVTVVDARKRPVAGAIVQGGGGAPSAVTDAKGRARINVPKGPSEIRVQREDLEATLSIDARRDLKVQVVLKKAR